MAIVDKPGLRGKMDGVVYRQVEGKTVASRSPRRKTKKKRKPSQAERARQVLFKDAMEYARMRLKDPWVRRAYQRLGRQMNRRYDKLLVTDYLTPPVVEEIDVSKYEGKPGAVIRVYAIDDLEVISVKVAIRSVDGSLVEEGPAKKMHDIWYYTTTAAAPAATPIAISATAMDRPEHEGTLSVPWPPLPS